VECCGSFRRGKPSCGDVDILIGPPADRESTDIVPHLVAELDRLGFLTDHLSLPHELTATSEARKDALSPMRPQTVCQSSQEVKTRVKRKKTTYVTQLPASQTQTTVDKDSDYDSDDYESDASAHDLDSPISKYNEIDLSDTTNTDRRCGYMGICKLSDYPHFRRIDIKSYPRCSWACALLYFTGSDIFNRSMRYRADHVGYTLSDRFLRKCIRNRKGERIVDGPAIRTDTEKHVFDVLEIEYRDPTDREGVISLLPGAKKGWFSRQQLEPNKLNSTETISVDNVSSNAGSSQMIYSPNWGKTGSFSPVESYSANSIEVKSVVVSPFKIPRLNENYFDSDDSNDDDISRHSAV